MANLNEFINANNGKGVEVEDPSNRNQCMDLAFAWLDAQGIPRATIRHLYAYQAFTQPSELTKQYFDLVQGNPSPGDLIVWGTGVGIAGHISIYVSGNYPTGFTTFDQNWPSGSKSHLQWHNSYGILGILKLKKGDGNMPTLASKEIVNGFYQTVLGREASDADAKNWVGQPVDQVFWGIAGSKERTDFVNYRVGKLYESALQRKASNEELSQWYKVPERNQFVDITESPEAKAVSKKYKECGSGGIDQATKEQIAETNNLVKQIWNKITNIFK